MKPEYLLAANNLLKIINRFKNNSFNIEEQFNTNHPNIELITGSRYSESIINLYFSNDPILYAELDRSNYYNSYFGNESFDIELFGDLYHQKEILSNNNEIIDESEYFNFCLLYNLPEYDIYEFCMYLKKNISNGIYLNMNYKYINDLSNLEIYNKEINIT